VDADTIIAKEGDYAVKGECNQIQRITKEYRDPARKCQRCLPPENMEGLTSNLSSAEASSETG
jgi:hypothetical protein